MQNKMSDVNSYVQDFARQNEDYCKILKNLVELNMIDSLLQSQDIQDKEKLHLLGLEKTKNLFGPANTNSKTQQEVVKVPEEPTDKLPY